MRGDGVRVDCGSCGFHLGWLVVDGETVTNTDSRPQPKTGPRIEYDPDHEGWSGRCKCGAAQRVRNDRLVKALQAVSSAGLSHMPFRGL